MKRTLLPFLVITVFILITGYAQNKELAAPIKSDKHQEQQSIKTFKDTDGDGVADSVDYCPTIPGPAEFDGCPDSDGDGIGDGADECPGIPGLAQFKGCPDYDNDGIPDHKDHCPQVAGTAALMGCPEISKEVISQLESATDEILFESGKTILNSTAIDKLNQVAGTLRNNPGIFIKIEGHTDDIPSKSVSNQELSQQRADAVKCYLMKKGIAPGRMMSVGRGAGEPLADNSTASGRAKNRRVVISVIRP